VLDRIQKCKEIIHDSMTVRRLPLGKRDGIPIALVYSNRTIFLCSYKKPYI
jgi:hypothetical protein